MAETPFVLHNVNELFIGIPNPRCASLCIHRFNRVALALSQFLCGDIHNETRRRRWRIGLLTEIVSFGY